MTSPGLTATLDRGRRTATAPTHCGARETAGPPAAEATGGLDQRPRGQGHLRAARCRAADHPLGYPPYRSAPHQPLPLTPRRTEDR